MKADLEPAERKLHAACPSETCSCPVCLIPRRLYEAWGVMDAARKLVKHNACLASAALKLCPPAYPTPENSTCACTYCKLDAALKAFDAAPPPPPEWPQDPGASLLRGKLGVDYPCPMCGALAGSTNKFQHSLYAPTFWQCHACGYPGK